MYPMQRYAAVRASVRGHPVEDRVFERATIARNGEKGNTQKKTVARTGSNFWATFGRRAVNSVLISSLIVGTRSGWRLFSLPNGRCQTNTIRRMLP